jgi:5-methyltetrahydrofolate--homocysteine methyltransferase
MRQIREGSAAAARPPATADDQPAGRGRRAGRVAERREAKPTRRVSPDRPKKPSSGCRLREVADSDEETGDLVDAPSVCAPTSAPATGPHAALLGLACVVEQIPLKAPLGYINETMLFQVQWGFRKKGRSADEWQHYRQRGPADLPRAGASAAKMSRSCSRQAVYGYWPCNADGDEPGHL